MSIWESIILGIIQGLTEFLPVSSSGHIELGKAILEIEGASDSRLSIILHGGTLLSTVVVFAQEIQKIINGSLNFENKTFLNEDRRYILKIIISMLPVLVIGLGFKHQIEELFFGNVLLVGFMLIFTGALLLFTHYAKEKTGSLNYKNAFIIGLAQAVALAPGISRSGSTIATALILGVDKKQAAQFSFLMVLVPILGANILELKDWNEIDPTKEQIEISILVMAAGFVTAFLVGLLACKWMINLVKNGKLTYFAIYCFVVGAIAIIYELFFASAQS